MGAFDAGSAEAICWSEETRSGSREKSPLRGPFDSGRDPGEIWLNLKRRGGLGVERKPESQKP